MTTILAAPSVATVLTDALEWIANVNAMDYEYREKAREALAALSISGAAATETAQGSSSVGQPSVSAESLASTGSKA